MIHPEILSDSGLTAGEQSSRSPTAQSFDDDAPAGLTRALFGERGLDQALTTDPKVAIASATASDCGPANVSIGPSGSGTGGALGGEKKAGERMRKRLGAWKRYTRQQTNTVRYSRDLPLTRRIRFEF